MKSKTHIFHFYDKFRGNATYIKILYNKEIKKNQTKLNTFNLIIFI